MKRLAMQLAQANSEEEAISILEEAGYWNQDSAWHYYGNFENNFSTIGNQQSLPESAMVEKIINAVDAVLLRECYLKGIDPESKYAPASISDALIEYFSIRDGKLSNLDPKARRKLSDNIYLVATGSKTNPCYSVIDRGEGIMPHKFNETILSLNRSNKLRVPFVQGKFNMGGTGALLFSGRHNLQLIISKRHPKLDQTDPDAKYWGLTVVRRFPPQENSRSSTYKYLAPKGELIKFNAHALPLLPDTSGKAFVNLLEFGTYIKLYDYQMSGFKTNIVFDLYYRLSLLMPGIAMPVRLVECRGYEGHSLHTTLSGLHVRLEEDKRDNMEPGYPSTISFNLEGKKLNALVYVFKKNQGDKYRRDEGVLFTINGQTHGSLSKSFFRRQAVKLGYIADSLLVIVDCTKIDGETRENLFMNSRDRLRSGELKRQIEQELERELSTHRGLKALQEERRRQAMEDKLGDSRPMAEVLEKLITKSPTLYKLFHKGERLSNPYKMEDVGKAKEYKGKTVPTYFDILTKDKERSVPRNKRLRIQLETDVVNDYFNRDACQGECSLATEGKAVESYSINLFNGIATLNVHLPVGIRAGAKLCYTLTVTDDTQVKSFVNDFVVTILPEQKSSGGAGDRVTPPGGSGEDRKAPSKLSLPSVNEVYKDSWSKYGFDKESALKVVPMETGYDFHINMDNIHLQTEIKADIVGEKYLKAKYKFGMVLIGLSLINAYQGEGEEKNDEEIDIPNTILLHTRALSPILLPMIDSLGALELDE